MRRLHPGKLRPVHSVVLSFVLAAAVGWLVLTLPVCGRQEPLPWLDALFLSVSAVCVTGLSTVNVGQAVSDVGHGVLLVLIQVGGLNYMVISTGFMVLVGQRLMLRRQMVLREAMGQESLGGVVRLWRLVLCFTFAAEAIGAVLLALRLALAYDVPWREAARLGVFHSVSAFCNAGLDLFGAASARSSLGAAPDHSSLAVFAGDPLVLLVMGGLIIVGGLGFVVVLDLLGHRKGRRLSVHTRLVLASTLWLLVLGALGFWLLEHNNAMTLGAGTRPQAAMGAVFQSVSTRTAGFSTFDQEHLHTSSKLLTVLLMIIGASPGGTGGGLKTTTVAVIVLAALASARGDDDLHVFRRRIPHDTVYRALAVGLMGVATVCLVTFLLTITEHRMLPGPAAGEAASTLDLFFEATSAFGTVGLSAGVTPGLSVGGKLLLIVTMLAGRIGPLTLAVALVARRQRRHRRYPEAGVNIG